MSPFESPNMRWRMVMDRGVPLTRFTGITTGQLGSYFMTWKWRI